MKAFEIVHLLEGQKIDVELVGDNNIEVKQVAGLVEATVSHLSFFNDPKRISELNNTAAGIVFLPKNINENITNTKIYVADPYVAYAILAQALNPRLISPGIAKTAIISSSAVIPNSCQVEPNVIIGDNVRLGENCKISNGSVINKNSRLGNNVTIYSNVTIEEKTNIGNDSSIESGTVIGGQGFGFANNKGTWLRIPQIGSVIIGNNVWIGNNCTIDRGTINNTIIGDNCIIDNLVHIAHNVEIGSGSAIAGQVGFAGSSKIGKNNIFAGQVGVTGHIETADNAHFGAKAGITNTIKTSGSYSGFPAVETPVWQKTTVRIKSLDKMAKKIRMLEKELQKLKLGLEK